MKYVIFIALLFSSLLTAQSESIDSCATEMAQDSICISDIVQQQIDKARQKQSEQIMPAVSEASLTLVPKIIPTPTVNERLLNLVKTLPFHVLLFVTVSFLIILSLLLRRGFLSVKKRSSRTLKNKISSLREEKIITKVNSRLNRERKKLKDRKSIFNASEKHISKLAKELSIAKGELFLASRLKLFEIGKL